MPDPEALQNQRFAKLIRSRAVTLCVTFQASLTIIDQYFGLKLTVL